MNESQLIRTIKAHIEKGDKATEKAEQHYISAGQHLKELKAQHGGTWAEWEALLKEKVGIGKSRASELMQIADGRKTVGDMRAGTAERVRQLRQRESSPLRNGETEPTTPKEISPVQITIITDPPNAPDCPRCGGKMRLHTTIHAATVGELLRALKAHQDALYQRGLVDLDEMPLTIEPRQPRKTAAS